MRLRRIIFLITILSLLTSCGGGGSSDPDVAQSSTPTGDSSPDSGTLPVISVASASVQVTAEPPPLFSR